MLIIPGVVIAQQEITTDPISGGGLPPFMTRSARTSILAGRGFSTPDQVTTSNDLPNPATFWSYGSTLRVDIRRRGNNSLPLSINTENILGGGLPTFKSKSVTAAEISGTGFPPEQAQSNNNLPVSASLAKQHTIVAEVRRRGDSSIPQKIDTAPLTGGGLGSGPAPDLIDLPNAKTLTRGHRLIAEVARIENKSDDNKKKKALCAIRIAKPKQPDTGVTVASLAFNSSLKICKMKVGRSKGADVLFSISGKRLRIRGSNGWRANKISLPLGKISSFELHKGKGNIRIAVRAVLKKSPLRHPETSKKMRPVNVGIDVLTMKKI